MGKSFTSGVLFYVLEVRDEQGDVIKDVRGSNSFIFLSNFFFLFFFQHRKEKCPQRKLSRVFGFVHRSLHTKRSFGIG